MPSISLQGMIYNAKLGLHFVMVTLHMHTTIDIEQENINGDIKCNL
jgi:hypothetical protein